MERVRKQKPISKRPKASVHKKLSMDYREILNESKKQSSKNSFKQPPNTIREVDIGNYNTLRSNKNFQELELKLRDNSQSRSVGPNQTVVSELVDSVRTGVPRANTFNVSLGGLSRASKAANNDGEETPAKLRVSKIEFEPSLRSHFTSVKKKPEESLELNQKETLGKPKKTDQRPNIANNLRREHY